MDNFSQATIIIPAYNEQNSIEKTVSEVKMLGERYHVLVIDDGSVDDTAALAIQAGAEVISHPYNKGYGASLKTGIERAHSDNIVFFDADGQHDVKDIPRMVELIKMYDMVVGDRSSSNNTYAYRLPGKWFLSKVANFLVGHHIPDLNCGFRCLRRDKAMKFISILPNGFSCSTTLTLAFYKEGLSVGFIPVYVRSRLHGRSEVNYLRDGAKTLLLITRITALFNPLKVFAPVGLAIATLGIIYGLYSVITESNITDTSVLTILVGVLIIFFGILADQVASIRRQIK